MTLPNEYPEINEYSRKYSRLWQMSREINRKTAENIYNQLNNGIWININLYDVPFKLKQVDPDSYHIKLNAYYSGDGHLRELKLSNEERRRIRKDLRLYLQL